MSPITIKFYPIIDVRARYKNINSNISLVFNFTNFGLNKCINPSNICSYMENLNRLQIIDITDQYKLMDNEYEILKNNSFLKNTLKGSNHEDLEFIYILKSFHLTNLGLNFIKSCVM